MVKYISASNLLSGGKVFEFVDSIVGGVVPKQYIPAVEKGLREGLEEGCSCQVSC